MDMSKNIIPPRVSTIHLIAVCGTGMGALAGMLKDAGYGVTGSDANVYPPMSSFLEKKGIPVAKGFSAENLDHAPDLVVVGNAISRDNPEAVALREKGLCFCSFPQAVNRFFAAEKTPILVTGTHGKTTTSALIAWLIAAVGLDPTFMVGGILINFDSNHQVGQGPHVVIEGDEYDTAFFDKGPKFLHYTPSRAVLTSVEFDHADIYADLGAVKGSFSRFTQAMPAESLLVHYDADENIKDVLRGSSCWKASYGLGEKSVWRISGIEIEPPWTHFTVSRRGEVFSRFKTKLMGEHNLLNALSAVAVAADLRIPEEGIAAGLETFAGVKRRQEVRGAARGVTVMDDFAHHPTAVRETIRAVKPFYPDGRLIAVFEPRTNSSRRNVFQDLYPAAFDAADLCLIRRPPGLEKIPEGERFSSEKLVADITARGGAAQFFPDTDAIIDRVKDEAKPGDLVLVMSNGGFDNIHERLLAALS